MISSSSSSSKTTIVKKQNDHLKPSKEFIRKIILLVILLILWVSFLIFMMRPVIGNTLLFVSEFQFQPLDNKFEEDENYQASKYLGDFFFASSSSAQPGEDDETFYN